jgi:2',3'-cyclic-nucleotide 2'-phosphodiesterase/3'-nucleotidase/5'-nucleotidase
VSAYNNLEVTTRGVVTYKTNTGFYLQDGVNTSSGSAGILVSTGAGSYYLSLVSIGDLIKISGKVFEFGFTNQLPITEITSITEVTILSSNNPLPLPINIGKNFNNVPSLVIDNGNINDFNQYAYAIDYWENYESMLVRIDSPQVIGQLKSFGNFAVVLDMDNPNRIRTTYGGVKLEQNGNSDLIQISNVLMPSNPIFYSVYPGDSISYITGIVSYDFGYYYILPRNIADIGVIQRGQISTDLLASTPTTPPAYVNQQALTPLATPHISIITQNMYNLTIKPNEQRMAKYARQNLLSPEIIFMQEIQDDSGLADNGVVTSNFNLDYLIGLLNDPIYNVPPYPTRNYAYVYVPPDNNQDGGAFAGNIRVVILYDTLSTSVQSYYRIGLPTSTPPVTNNAFQNSRKPLYVEIKHIATNETYHLIDVHANSKGGDTSLWGSVQPPNEVSEPQRVNQFTYIKNWITANLNKNVDNIVVAGDCNDFEWSQSVEVLDNNTPSRFMKNLVNDVNYSERYSFYFNGVYQVLDNMFISPSLYNKITSVFNTNVNIPNKPYIKFSDVLSCQFWLENIGEPILTDHNTLCARIPL